MVPGTGGTGEGDLELIDRWKRGDTRAATLLVSRHAPALARFAVSSGVMDDVEELVQDTFVRAFASLGSFRGESSLRTWLFTIERRLMMDRRRAAMRRPSMVEVESVTLSTSYDALDGILASETEGRTRRAIGQLPPMQREVFTLRVEQGLAYREIAEVVGTTEGAARVHYHNAVRAVKEYLND